MKKILILGNKWHGNWSLTLHQEIIDAGYDSEHIDVRYTKKFSFSYFEYFRKRFFFSSLKQALLTKLRQDKTIELVIVITPYTIPVQVWKLIKEHKIKLIGWWGDDPMIKKNIGLNMQYFDKIYLVDKAWITNSKYFNPEIQYLPHAASEKDFYSIENIVKKYDISFVGDSYEGAMNGQLRAQILKKLHENGFSVALFGDKGWHMLFPAFPFLKQVYKGPVSSREGLNKIYNESKIILNIHHNQLQTGANQKIFEASMAKGFQLSDYKQEIELQFQKNIALYSSTEELIEKASYFLEHPEEREIMSEQAHRIITQEHTYKKRIKVILKK